MYRGKNVFALSSSFFLIFLSFALFHGIFLEFSFYLPSAALPHAKKTFRRLPRSTNIYPSAFHVWEIIFSGPLTPSYTLHSTSLRLRLRSHPAIAFGCFMLSTLSSYSLVLRNVDTYHVYIYFYFIKGAFLRLENSLLVARVILSVGI